MCYNKYNVNLGEFENGKLVEIRQVERPKNTVVKNYFGKFKVVKRTANMWMEKQFQKIWQLLAK